MFHSLPLTNFPIMIIKTHITLDTYDGGCQTPKFSRGCTVIEFARCHEYWEALVGYK